MSTDASLFQQFMNNNLMNKLSGVAGSPQQAVTSDSTAMYPGSIVTSSKIDLGRPFSNPTITIKGKIVRELVEDYLNEYVFKNSVRVKAVVPLNFGGDDMSVEFVDTVDSLGGPNREG